MNFSIHGKLEIFDIEVNEDLRLSVTGNWEIN
jgi:hypothetical protein